MKCYLLILFFGTSFYISVAQPDTVKAGAYIISVHDINFHDKEYTIRFWLWFLYSNPDFDFYSQSLRSRLSFTMKVTKRHA